MQKKTLSTQTRKLERDLVQPVMRYLREIGCNLVAAELKFFDRGIDVYGVRRTGRRSVTYAVELKLKKWPRALQQAAIYQLCCDFSYVAMPLKSVLCLDLSVFRNTGIGVLFVRPDGSVGQMLEAQKSSEVRKHYVEALSRAISEESTYAVQ